MYWNNTIDLAFAVGLQYIETYNYERISLPGNPNVKMNHTANPKTWRAIAMLPFWSLVADADVEMLMVDEAKRQLYADLVEYTLIPPLREFANIVATKMHLPSLFNIAQLDKMLPGLGQSWACKSSLYQIFVDTAIYARQFEVASARMKAGDWSLLCPISPDLIAVVAMTIMQLKEAAGKKERTLLGASSGTGTLASTSFMTESVEGETSDTADT